MSVRFFDYRVQLESLRNEVLAAIERVLDSGRLILGPEVEAFEQEFAHYLGAEGEAVGVKNGTDALVVILRAMGIGPGDEVVTVANTAVPTVGAIRETGATPVFCDVVRETGLMDLDDVAARLSERTMALLPVHLFGNVVDVPRLRELVGARPIRIIEDCAQAHGARLNGRMAGTLGDAAAFSFYPTKNLGAYGDGGLCHAPDAELAGIMRSIRFHGFGDHYHAEREGMNSRLDEIQAAVLRVKLSHLDEWVARRRELAGAYDRLLSPEIERPAAAPGVEHAYHLYAVRIADRDGVRRALAKRGIETGIHYPVPIHLMRGYRFLGHGVNSLPVTERLAGELLSLPLYPELTDEAQAQVAEALNAAVA